MKMTLDEAIKHAEEVAEEKEDEGKLLCQSEAASAGCLTCAKEHRQLAEWLKELKSLKEKDEAKAVRYEGDGYADGAMVFDYAFCPNCDHEIEADSEN